MTSGTNQTIRSRFTDVEMEIRHISETDETKVER